MLFRYIRHIRIPSRKTEKKTLEQVIDKKLPIPVDTELNYNTPTRSYCVGEVYPRMLYSFSEVICFVTSQPNTGEVTLSQLIKWADKFLTKTTNQPALPRVIIIVNGPRTHTEEWLNEDTVTGELLDRFRAMEIIDPGLRKIAETWSSPVYHIASSPRSLQDLLELYFSGIRVVSIPSRELVAPDVLQGQIFQLRNRLLTESQLVQNKKEGLWTWLNTLQLQIFFNKAFVRFTTAPDHPFDFYAVLRSISLPPQNFGEYIVDLMEAIEMIDMGESIPGRDDRLARLLASYMSFASLNNSTDNSNFGKSTAIHLIE
jgi:hypothetical protein